MSPSKEPPLMGLLNSSGAVHSNSETQRERERQVTRGEDGHGEDGHGEGRRTPGLSVSSQKSLVTLWIIIHAEVLGVKDHGKSIISDLQNETSIDQTVGWFEPTMTQTSEMKILHPLNNKKKQQQQPIRWSYFCLFFYFVVECCISTLIRSMSSEDLNIQSSLMLLSASRSAKLPRGQCSTTMAKMPESQNRPRYEFRFSWRMSRNCSHKKQSEEQRQLPAHKSVTSICNLVILI